MITVHIPNTAEALSSAMGHNAPLFIGVTVLALILITCIGAVRRKS